MNRRRRLLRLGFDATVPVDRPRENPPRPRPRRAPTPAVVMVPADAPLGSGWVA